MVTDGILSAVQVVIDNLKTPEEHCVGEIIWNMLSNFDEDEWYKMSDKEKDKWISKYMYNEQNDGFNL